MPRRPGQIRVFGVPGRVFGVRVSAGLAGDATVHTTSDWKLICAAPGTRDWPLAGPIQELAAPDPQSLTIVPDSPWHPASEPPHPAPTVPLRPQGMQCQTATEASDGDTPTLRVERNPPARLRLGVNKATEGQCQWPGLHMASASAAGFQFPTSNLSPSHLPQ